MLIIKKNALILSRKAGRIFTVYDLKKINIIWSNPKNTTLALNTLLPKFGINFINENVEVIEPKSNKVITESKKEIYYDYLGIATGSKLNFDAESQKENAYSICTL